MAASKNASRAAKTSKQRSNSAAAAEAEPGLSTRRRWLGRIMLAVLTPLLMLGLVELTLRAVGYGYDPRFFVESDTSGVWLSNPRFTWRFFGPELSRAPIPQRISVDKPEGTFRIFVLGASAARGEPNPAYSFARTLETMLDAAAPRQRFEIINTGVTAINSHVVLPIAHECLDYDPDLFIIYLGNNEVVGPFGAGSSIEAFTPSRRVIKTAVKLREFRVGQLVATLQRSARRGGDAESWGGMSMFVENAVRADDPRLDAVYENFRANLDDITHAARQRGVPVLLSTLVTNLRDQPPLHPLNDASLSADRLAEFERELALVRQAGAQGDAATAMQHLQLAAAIDPSHAELYFIKGQLELGQGMNKEALVSLIRARDLDALRFRADTRINNIIREVAAEVRNHNVKLFDAERALLGSPDNPSIPGRSELFEHVHLTLAGNYRVAGGMVQAILPMLPREVQPEPGAEVALPNFQACVQQLVLTPFDQISNLAKILGITGKPPFSIAQGDRDRADLRRLQTRLTQEMLDGAEASYQRALEDRPDDILLRSNYADLLFGVGKNREAEREWSRLLDDYPLSADWNVSRSIVLSETGLIDQALEGLDRAIAINPARVDARVGRAQMLSNRGLRDEARAQLETALRLRPRNGQANCMMASMLEADGDLDGALRHLVTSISSGDGSSCPRDLGELIARKTDRTDPIELEGISLGTLREVVAGMTGRNVDVDWSSLEAIRRSPESRVSLRLSGPDVQAAYRDLLGTLKSAGIEVETTDASITWKPVAPGR